jgi:hypothetical protein
MGKEIIECNHGALARVCDRCEAENEKYRLAAEVERLRAEIDALKAELHLAKSLRKEER